MLTIFHEAEVPIAKDFLILSNIFKESVKEKKLVEFLDR